METGFEEGYYFYILSYNDTDGNVIVGEDGKAIDDSTNAKSVNLIMDRNIYYDESTDTSIGATSINTEFIEWNSGSFRDGPVTAMDYLYNATKAWTNVLDIEMNYTDEGNGYGKVITSAGVTKITKKDGTSVIVLTNQVGYNNLKARMPYKSEVSDYDSTNQTNAYLYDNLDSNGGITYSGNIEDIYGYWILSFDLEDTSAEYACFVFYEGRVYSY